MLVQPTWIAARNMPHKIRQGFYLSACGWLGRSCEHFGPLSRQGCTADKWVVHMRDRSRIARCYELPRSANAAESGREPDLPDFLDMFGQPGQR
jgi:hypothetical protein